MRSIDNWFDRFCRKHPGLGIPNLMKIVVFGTVIVYLLDLFLSILSPGLRVSSYLSFQPYYIIHGLQIWRLVTFVFVPLNTNPVLVLVSLYFYWFIGNTLESEWGSVKFTAFYGVGYLLNLAAGLLLALFFGGFSFPAVTADVTYLNLSLFFAFATLFPDVRFLLFFIIPVKAKWLGWIDAAFFLLAVAGSLVVLNFVGAILPLISILNYVLFFWSDIAEFTGRTTRRVKHKTSRQTINFKQAAREQQQHKGYIHKCAVCGKTDTDYPDEEFRYCSKCNGYYCYCSEHIGNHVHIE